MGFQNYWYILCESKELKANQALARQILDEWIVVFRNRAGQAVALQDRCLHRASRLSEGRVKDHRLVCHYHGWTYDGLGRVVRVPSDSPVDVESKRCAKSYRTREQDDFIYVCLDADSAEQPFSMPSYQRHGYMTLRLQHEFDNTVTNCAENFVDIPHTTYVHPGVFRYDRRQKLTAQVERFDGRVRAEYKQETDNFGIFSRILNPSGQEIRHIDEFIAPNITCVQYFFGPKKHFIITSQSVPISEQKTLVYTDLTYNYGWWNWLARPVIYIQAKIIISQDVRVLAEQMEVINKYGTQFQNGRSDIIHVYIESIRDEISQNRDPRALARKSSNVEFWI